VLEEELDIDEDENISYKTEDKDGFYIRQNGKFNKISSDELKSYPPLEERALTIAIKPSDEFITAVKNHYDDIANYQKTAVKSVIEKTPLLIIAFILMLFVLVMGGYNAKDKKYTMGFIEKIFSEIPIAVIVLSVFFGIIMIDYKGICQGFTELYNEEMFITAYGFAYFVLFGIIILMLNTLVTRIKCRSFWKTTFIWAMMVKIYGWIKKVKNVVAEKTVNRDMLRNDKFTRRFVIRTAAFVSAEIFFALIFLDFGAYGFLFFVSFVLLSGYIVLSIFDLRAMNRISQHITAINSGDYTPHIEPKDSSAYCLTEKLNNISSGIQTAVDRQVRSERMKIDLVTNVSHDLKTPLTSIISYIDLLSTEELSPEARDYVTIIENKSQRLKSMVADLFDLAKATSHTDIDMEKIDIVILSNQVLADLNDKIEASGKIIRTEIQAETAPVMADGKKMYRVFQNLIDNALKYSLNGTRIYLALKNELGYCIISIKNIASYEMNFAPDEIIERFTRGDESRSTEGNGLGLSIAKSFTEACGGTFRITIDGDVFT
ncbi:MAG: HAMP domain-containing histidine kinase, partial [Ruminococcus sp.]|nr:HAMP domain-containing histidine kinase [Ruminococcus sp.]